HHWWHHDHVHIAFPEITDAFWNLYLFSSISIPFVDSRCFYILLSNWPNIQLDFARFNISRRRNSNFTWFQIKTIYSQRVLLLLHTAYHTIHHWKCLLHSSSNIWFSIRHISWNIPRQLNNS
ncbi:unnamed protein product, partial [Trichobilharzia szidati]